MQVKWIAKQSLEGQFVKKGKENDFEPFLVHVSIHLSSY